MYIKWQSIIIIHFMDLEHCEKRRDLASLLWFVYLFVFRLSLDLVSSRKPPLPPPPQDQTKSPLILSVANTCDALCHVLLSYLGTVLCALPTPHIKSSLKCVCTLLLWSFESRRKCSAWLQKQHGSVAEANTPRGNPQLVRHKSQRVIQRGDLRPFPHSYLEGLQWDYAPEDIIAHWRHSLAFLLLSLIHPLTHLCFLAWPPK